MGFAYQSCSWLGSFLLRHKQCLPWGVFASRKKLSLAESAYLAIARLS
jgi:hypothetical protein